MQYSLNWCTVSNVPKRTFHRILNTLALIQSVNLADQYSDRWLLCYFTGISFMFRLIRATCCHLLSTPPMYFGSKFVVRSAIACLENCTEINFGCQSNTDSHDTFTSTRINSIYYLPSILFSLITKYCCLWMRSAVKANIIRTWPRPLSGTRTGVLSNAADEPALMS